MDMKTTPPFHPKTNHKFVKYGDNSLEMQLFHDPFPQRAFILFSPYPPMGGTMSFPLIREIFQSLTAQIFDTKLVCRFNYRGVGQSDGNFQEDTNGIEDGKAVIQHILTQFPSITRISLIGYSYGAAVCARLVQEMEKFESIVYISPPVSMFPSLFNDLKDYVNHSQRNPPNSSPMSQLFLMGKQDQFTTLQAFLNFPKKIPNARTIVIPDADHFWTSDQEIVVQIIKFLTP